MTARKDGQMVGWGNGSALVSDKKQKTKVACSIHALTTEGVNPETLKDKVDDGSERRANGRVAEMVRRIEIEYRGRQCWLVDDYLIYLNKKAYTNFINALQVRTLPRPRNVSP